MIPEDLTEAEAWLAEATAEYDKAKARRDELLSIVYDLKRRAYLTELLESGESLASIGIYRNGSPVF